MQCPVCASATLDIRHSHGIEVDVCPSCNGVWLDRGELDKIMTQAQTEPALGAYQPPEDPSTSTEENVPASFDRRATDDDDDDEDDDGREEWKSDRRSHKRRAEDRDDSDRSERSKKSKKRKPKSFGDRLEDILDDVLDLDDIFD